MSDLIVCLMGPTASGKTALAMELVQHFPFELISVDSAMIYREMDIGTAKPSPEELKKTPHHLINIRDPIESYSAAEFCEEAQLLCQSIRNKGKVPLLVGGTMMYFNALQKGLAQLPKADPQLRLELEREAQQQGWPSLHQKLKEVDPLGAARIHPHDAQRIQRALEVYFLSGSTLSDLVAQQKKTTNPLFFNILLLPQQRAWLHERIALRFKQMLAEGLIEEVSQLQAKWNLNLNMPAMRCVGYRQVFEYIQGNLNYSLMVEQGIAATRQLAKRQLTWLRSWEQAWFYDPQKTQFSTEIIAKIKEILDNDFH